jgi:hypothetical protein
MNKFTTSVTALALAAGFGFATIAPASADQAAATRNQILGGLALIAGVATAVNASNKNARAHTLEGYTRDGSAVYQDGHVVAQDGQSYYPGNENQSISCDNGNCSIYGNDGYANGRWYRNRGGWRR